MALKDIFKMTKANRYTADGREELIKAQEAVTEDRRYNIGEISEKTGLQKTANGWVKPKNGKQPGAKTGPGKSPDATGGKWKENKDYLGRKRISMETPQGGKEDLPDFIKGFSIVSEEHDQDTRAANAKLYPSLQPLVRQREPFMKKRIEAFTKLRDNPGNPKARADFVDATNAINQIDADIDRAYKKASSEAEDVAPHVLTGDTRIRVRK